MIQFANIENIGNAACATRLRIPSPKHHTIDSRVYQGGSTHDARLERDVERRAA